MIEFLLKKISQEATPLESFILSCALFLVILGLTYGFSSFVYRNFTTREYRESRHKALVNLFAQIESLIPRRVVFRTVAYAENLMGRIYGPTTEGKKGVLNYFSKESLYISLVIASSYVVLANSINLHLPIHTLAEFAFVLLSLLLLKLCLWISSRGLLKLVALDIAVVIIGPAVAIGWWLGFRYIEILHELDFFFPQTVSLLPIILSLYRKKFINYLIILLILSVEISLVIFLLRNGLSFLFFEMLSNKISLPMYLEAARQLVTDVLPNLHRTIEFRATVGFVLFPLLVNGVFDFLSIAFTRYVLANAQRGEDFRRLISFAIFDFGVAAAIVLTMVVVLGANFYALTLYQFEWIIEYNVALLNSLWSFEFPTGRSQLLFYYYISAIVPTVFCAVGILLAMIFKLSAPVARPTVTAIHGFVSQDNKEGSEAADRTIAVGSGLAFAGLLFWALA